MSIVFGRSDEPSGRPPDVARRKLGGSREITETLIFLVASRTNLDYRDSQKKKLVNLLAN